MNERIILFLAGLVIGAVIGFALTILVVMMSIEFACPRPVYP